MGIMANKAKTQFQMHVRSYKISISPKFVLKGLINKFLSLVDQRVCRRTEDINDDLEDHVVWLGHNEWITESVCDTCVCHWESTWAW